MIGCSCSTLDRAVGLKMKSLLELEEVGLRHYTRHCHAMLISQPLYINTGIEEVIMNVQKDKIGNTFLKVIYMRQKRSPWFPQ